MAEAHGPNGPNFIGPDWKEALGTNEPVSFPMIHFAELVDTEGIPLRSDRSSLAVATDGSIDWEYGDCPYNSSPSRLPENQPEPARPMSFLERKRLRENYGEVLGIMSYIRQRKDKANDGVLDFGYAYSLLTSLKFSLPYLVFRADEPLDSDKIPSSLLFTQNSSIGGLGGLRDSMSERAGPSGVPSYEPVPSAEKITEKAESSGTLIGPNTVCAASPSMMRHFFNAVTKGEDLDRAETPEWFLELLPEEQLSDLEIFSEAMEASELAFRRVQAEDPKTAESIEKHLAKPPKKRNPRRVRSMFNNFFQIARSGIGEIEDQHLAINYSLGRKAVSMSVSVSQLGPLEVTRLAEELYSEDPMFLPADIRTQVSS